jgi:uncharacterized RDD family membrane protein YckC
MLYMIAPFLGYNPEAFAAEVEQAETAGPSVAARTMMDRQWLGTLGVTLGAVSALAVGALLQCAWKNTPGKHLMQLRILDSYGNVPRIVTLFSRFFFQVAPFSAAAALMLIPLPEMVESVVRATAWLFLLVDWAVGLFSRDALTLHDRFFGTRVVLDTTATMLDPKR